MEYIAHSENENGKKHSLNKHLNDVADITNSFCGFCRFHNIFNATGKLHDLGKYQPEFQRYLREGGRRGSVPHASWGAAFAKQFKLYEAAFAIDGHHKGLPDMADLQDDIAEFNVPGHELFSTIKEIFFKDLGIDENELNTEQLKLNPFERDVFIRYLFSSLTDADWLDTEKHFNSTLAEIRKAPEFNTSYLIEKLEGEIKNKSKEGYINQLRNQVREYAINNACGATGFYSMTLPTGMGKTLASMSWALHHAKHNKLKRIIIVLPFISIIDQTARELKRIFGDEWVLEHHSNFNDDETLNREIADENIEVEKYAKRLATENWDYPIIVTTSVQFFESLFGNKPARCRKVHNIAQSVVIFDEVQSLPKELVMPTLSMLKDVQKIMGASFLFCTATQPAFEKTEKFNGIENIEPLVENPKEIFGATRRVSYNAVNNYQPVEISDLASKVKNEGVSTLSIFNTKNKALLFFKEIQNCTGYKTFHLSTSMYPAHRKRVISEIRERLKNNEKILVASTQLIEAGVDFDFPCVYREIAPLESIIQSAGRCNREGKMDTPGRVIIFAMADASAPNRQYSSLANFAKGLYNGKEELLFEHDFFKEYYRKALDLFVDADKKKIEDDRKACNFKTVAEKYQLIENKTTPIFILCDESRTLYERIRYKPILSRSDFRAMQQFSVLVYDNFLKEHIGKLGREPQGYWLWHGEYSSEFGISTENPVMIL
ncbi:MAG: CRISPR-associated helicase Cas3' [Prolixibacteraceae bacterium]|nr:CRISPR-associated helicase Cas3' [Prolixibacteraceae bacterium]